MSVETDPKKIAERLEQTRQARFKCVPKNAEEASEQLLRHSWQSGRITEEEYRSQLKEAIAFIEKQRAEANSNENPVDLGRS